MKHRKRGRKFGREKDIRRALLKSLASSFFIFGKIKTTEAKAKELRPLVERFITRAKIKTLSTQKFLRRFFTGRVVEKIFVQAQSFSERRGGYTRVVKLGPRRGDGAKMAILELVK